MIVGKYEVRPNHCNCHPETCCCNDWAIYAPDGAKHTTYFNKINADQVCNSLNNLVEVIDWQSRAIAAEKALKLAADWMSTNIGTEDGPDQVPWVGQALVVKNEIENVLGGVK